MEILIIAALVVLAASLFLVQRARKNSGAAPSRKSKGKPRAAMEALDTVAAWPPQSTRVMTAGERKAYFVLRTALPDHMVLAQVPLSRFMKVPTRNSYSEWLRRVGLMSVDIVVCDATSQVVAVIDVRADDGKESPRARQRHARMDRVITAAQIPIHVWNENAIPSPTAARDLILNQPKGASDGPRDLPRLSEPVEADVMLEAELEQRDPPPSTWFDNLDSAAVPLGNVPAASGSTRPTTKRP